MDGDQRSSAIFSLVMVAATATLGLMALAPKGVQRVADTRVLSEVLPAEQDVVARLWEDPMQAVQAAVAKQNPEAKRDAAHGAEAVLEAVAKRAGSGKVCILVVPAPDTPFPDDLEVRLRMRYALQLAMAAQKFAPEDRNHLGYFSLEHSGELAPHAKSRGQVHVPYEWFQPRRQPGQARDGGVSVLVLWLPDSALSRDPLGILLRLRTALWPPTTGAEKLTGLFVIGPTSSDTLKKVAKSANEYKSPRLHALLEKLQGKLSFFSPRSTTPDPLLDLEYDDKWANARRGLAKRLYEAFHGDDNFEKPNTWVYLHNLIAPDDQLTDLIAAELALRGVHLTKTKPSQGAEGSHAPRNKDPARVMILAEADTAYGQSLPIAMTASMLTRATPDGGDPEIWLKRSSLTQKTIQSHMDNGTWSDDASVVTYRYLRGLDQQKGQDSLPKSVNRAAPKSLEELLAEILAKNSPPALGESQLDYVARLTDDLSRTHPGTIKAVGVLGGDIYDKLILLRSLRPKFPGAVFFTTDLDARLWHPDHIPFTRNLVVASAWGLARAEDTAMGSESEMGSDFDVNMRTAPFRDGYQSATFRACTEALRKGTTDAFKIRPLPGPFLYEIGSEGPVELYPATIRKGELPPSSNTERNGSVLKWILGLATLGTAAVVVVIWRKAKSNTRESRSTPADGRVTLLAFLLVDVVALVLFGAVTLLLSKTNLGEPWMWSGGVSIWPTEILRFGAALTVITVLYWAWRRFKEGSERLIARYQFDLPIHPNSYVAGPPPAAAGAEVIAETVFAQYQQKATVSRRCMRIAIATVLYTLFACAMIICIDGQFPDRPHVRGDVARMTDTACLAVSGFSFVVLLFYVLDAVWIASRLFKGISGPVTHWPQALLNLETARFRVRKTDLSGYLDVRFAAEKSAEVGQLVIYPFVVQFIFIISRNSYFDNWTWPRGLIVMFIINIVLACTAWATLRQTAKTIRDEALERLQDALDEADFEEKRKEDASVPQNKVRAMTTEVKEESYRFDQREDVEREQTLTKTVDEAVSSGAVTETRQVASPVISTLPETIPAAVRETVGLKERRHGLSILQRAIQNEQRGAYARLFQDPTLLAMILPSGICGIALIIFRALFTIG